MDEIDTGLTPPEPTPPPVNEAAEAQAAREAAALRTARGAVRKTPVAMTAQFPVKITDDASYEALQPGASFIDPEGNTRVKPWYVTDDKSYDAVPEGAEFVDPEGQRRSKPKYDQLPFTVQTFYNLAVNDRERLRVLEQAYPGKVKSDARGELYVEDGDKRIKAKGFTEAPGAYLTSQAGPVAGSVLGEIGGAVAGHRMLPFIGGMLGGVAGGGVGGAAGQMFNDTIMQIAGVYDRTGAEQAANVGTAGVMGAAGSAVGRVLLPMAPGLKQWVQESAPGALAKFLGADKDALGTAVGLADRGVQVPPSAWAKESPHLQNLVEVLDPAFRTQRVLEQSAAQHVERQGAKILGDLGIEDAGPLVKPTTGIKTEDAGNAVRARLMQESAAADAELADKIAMARATATADDVVARTEEAAVLRAAETNRQAAQRLIDDGYQQIQGTVDDAMRAANADVNSGSLWQQVAERLRAMRQGVVERHRRWYQQADEIAGDARPELGNLPQAAEQFLARLPEGFANRYPQIVQGIQDIANSNVTFGQLHNLRSQLRSDVDWFSLNRSIDDGANIFFNNQINAVLHNPNATGNLRTAAQMLDATDRSYGQNMAIFNDQRLRAVVKGIESGQPADPAELFNVLVKSGRSDLTRQVERMVGPTLWSGVRAADMQEILNASRTLIPGEIDGGKFINEVLKRHRDGMLEAVHGPNAARLMQQAQRIGVEDGSIPIAARPGDTMTELVQRAEQAAERARVLARERPMDTLEQEVKRITREHNATVGRARANDPLGFLMKPSIGATEAVNRILAKEDTILAAAARFGEKSPEFEMLRQIYAQRVLRETMTPGERLAKISPEVQQLMFPGVTLDQMKLLAKEMDFLMGTKAAKGGAGRSIMATERVEHPWAALPGGKAIGKFIPGVDAAGRAILGSYYKMMTELTTSPAFLKFVQRGLQGDEASRFTVRNMLQAMMYGKGANRGGAIGAGVGASVGAAPHDSMEFNPEALGAAQAPDGNWYLPDPQRPGKYLQVRQ